MTFCNDPRPRITRIPRFKKRPKKVAEPKPPNLPGPWYRCHTLSWEAPPSPKASAKEPLGVDLDGFKFSDADVRWELVPADLAVTTPALLLPRFRREWRWWLRPLAFVRNPEKQGMPVFGPYDVIVAVYSKGFYIVIERYGREMYGPHPARLYYRSHQMPGEIAWVAILQISAYWYSDERILDDLNAQIRNKKLWHSQHTANLIVLE